MDISPETMGTLSMIMLAQAQEVIFLKAASGARLKLIIDRIVAINLDLYGASCQALGVIDVQVLVWEL